MIGLTAKQRQLLEFIKARIQTTGVSPSISEMMDGLGYAEPRQVLDKLQALQNKGHIRRVVGQPRSITIMQERSVKLNPEIHRLAADYAVKEGVSLETATNELLRGALGAA